MQASRQELAAALRYLVGLDPDHARSANEIGFSQAHTHLGHALVAAPVECWSERAEQAARVLCWHYRGQLIAAGLQSDTQAPADTTLNIHPADVRRWIESDAVSMEYRIFCAYDPGIVAAIKAIPGRNWDSLARCWRVPFASGKALRAFALRYGIALTAEAAATPIPIMSPPPTAPVKMRRERLISLADPQHLSVQSEYDAAIVAELHRIGGRWNGMARTWLIPIHPPRRVEALADQFEFGFSVEAAHALDMALEAILRQASITEEQA